MAKLIDLTGRQFGNFTVISRTTGSSTGRSRWLCRCVCGNERICFGGNLRSGHSKSCGCIKTVYVRQCTSCGGAVTTPGVSRCRACKLGPSHEMSKACTKCGQVKTMEKFRRHSKCMDGRSGQCHDCASIYNKALKKKHPALFSASSRKSALKKKYGLTISEYDALAANGCHICGKEKDGDVRLAVDHDHATGAVRGVLCGRCNRTIGLLNDDPVLAMAAARYLAGTIELGIAQRVDCEALISTSLASTDTSRLRLRAQ